MNTNTKRRTILKIGGAGGALAAAISAGLFKPTAAIAAERNRAAFEATYLAAALKAVGAVNAAESQALELKAPDIPENAYQVPIDVISLIPNTVAIWLFVDTNHNPLGGVFEFTNGGLAEISIRVKFEIFVRGFYIRSSTVLAAAQTSDGLFHTKSKKVRLAYSCDGC